MVNLFMFCLHTHTHTKLEVGLVTFILCRFSDKLFLDETLRLLNQISLKGSSYVKLLHSSNE